MSKLTQTTRLYLGENPNNWSGRTYEIRCHTSTCLEILTVGKDIDPLIHVSGVILVVSARPNMGGNPRSIKTEGPSPYEWMFGNIYSSVGCWHAGDVRLVTRKNRPSSLDHLATNYVQTDEEIGFIRFAIKYAQLPGR